MCGPITLIIIEGYTVVFFSPRNEAMDCCQACSLIQDAKPASVLSLKVPTMLLRSLEEVSYFSSFASFIDPEFCPTILSTSDR